MLVFTRTKNRADLIGETLRQSGHRAAAIHGNLSLERRRAALEGFRRGRYRILVATDIAARGLDIDNIGHVINYDLPYTPEDYVHRIGRTARMAAVGRATSFATAADTQSVRAIETILGQSIPAAVQWTDRQEAARPQWEPGSPRSQADAAGRQPPAPPETHRPAGRGGRAPYGTGRHTGRAGPPISPDAVS